MKLKSFFIHISTVLCTSLFAFAQAPLGTIIEDDLLYSRGDPDNNGNFLVNLRPANFREFPNEVLLVVYHASW